MNAAIKPILYLQIVNWICTCLFVFCFIFLAHSPYWYETIKIGVGIQILLLLLYVVLTRNKPTGWLVINSIILVSIIIGELIIRDIIHVSGLDKDERSMALYLYIVFVISLFLLTLRFILKETRKTGTMDREIPLS